MGSVRAACRQRSAPAASRAAGKRTSSARSGHGAAPPQPASIDDVLELQATAGNEAVADLLAPPRPTAIAAQRATARWSDAPKDSPNAAARDFGTIRRVPIEGLTLGNQAAASGTEMQMTKESAAGRAIVLIPTGLDPTANVDVMLHFHGHTYSAAKHPFAGWRAHSSKTAEGGRPQVRDVDLDRIEGQLEAAETKQLIAILPQGVGTSQFGGLENKQVDYINQVLDRVVAVEEFRGKDGKPVSKRPTIGRLVLSAHSGGGDRIIPTLGGRQKQPAEVILFEAIHGQEGTVAKWAIGNLQKVLDVYRATADPVQRRAAIDACPRLRGYYSERARWKKKRGYKERYDDLRNQVYTWIDAQAAVFGDDVPTIKRLVRIIGIKGGTHETIIRGMGDKAAGGPLAHALRGLKEPTGTSAPEGAAPEPGITTATPATPTTAPSTKSTGAGAAPAGATTPGATTGAVAGASAARTADSITATDLFVVLARHNLASPSVLLTMAFKLAAASDALAGSADVLVGAGIREATDLTDMLFELVHPELEGGRIPAGAAGLAADWRRVRSDVARPALGRMRRAAEAAAQTGPSAPAPATPAGPATAPGTTTTGTGTGTGTAGGRATTGTGAGGAGTAGGRATGPGTAGGATAPAAPATGGGAQAAFTPIAGVAARYTLTDAERALLPNLAATRAELGRELATLRGLPRRERRPDQTARMQAITRQQARLAELPAVAQIERILARRNTTPAEWYAQIVSTSFLGIPLNDGVHQLMAERLRNAERDLTVTQGLRAQDLGMKADQGTDGLRPPKLATGGTRVSAHCFGLAVDLNYLGNPYLGLNNSSGSGDVVKRATKLIDGAEVDVLNTRQGIRPVEAYQLLAAASRSFVAYLRLRNNPTELARKAQALRVAGTDTRTDAQWQAQIQQDFDRLNGQGDFVRRDPENGFIDFDERVIDALTRAGLNWLGTSTGKKDIMHFQLEGIVQR